MDFNRPKFILGGCRKTGRNLLMKGHSTSVPIILAVAVSLLFIFPAALAAPAPGGSSVGGGYELGMKLSKPGPELRLDTGKYRVNAAVPDSVDISEDLPPIGDQEQHNSCVGFSTGYYYKTWYEKQEHPSWNLGDDRYYFSPAFIYNQINDGQDAGAMIGDAFQLLEETGDVDFEEFPYDGDYTKQPTSKQLEAAGQYRIPGDWGYIFAEMNWGPYWREDVIEDLKSWLAGGKPLVLGMPVYQDFYDCGNYYDYDGFSTLDGGHAVYIAGYDDDAGGVGQGGFLMINSWGPSWNGDGKVWLSYDFVQNHVPEAWTMNDQDSSPALSGINPDEGAPGDTVTLSGDNFGAGRRSAKVSFPNGKSGTVVSWTNTQIKTKVPNGTQSGSVCVCDWTGEKSNGKSFTAEPGTAAGWMLAEGATWPGFNEWVLIQNPNGSTAIVQVTFMTDRGEVAGPGLSIPGQSRMSINVNQFVPDRDVSTMVSSINGVPVCAERAMYVNTADGKWGSHDSIGAPEAASTWYLAEGATWQGFDEWIQVMNPNLKPVTVRVTYQTPGGEVAGPTMVLGARTRSTVHVNEQVPNSDVSAKVESLTEGLGIVAERSMYIRTLDGKIGCHNSMGMSETASGWGLAEGATWPGYEEWVLVQNPTAEATFVEFYFLTPEGAYTGPVELVPAGGRISVRVNDYMPESDVSTLVFTEEESKQVVVERAMYVRSGDGKLGAHNAPASVYMSDGWYLPEGCTSAGFDEWVLVMNPDPENFAQVQLTFMTSNGPVAGPAETLWPGSRKSFHVNAYVNGDVSTMVKSEGYVVCERALYISAAGKSGAHDSIGVISDLVLGGTGAGAYTGVPLKKPRGRRLPSR